MLPNQSGPPPSWPPPVGPPVGPQPWAPPPVGPPRRRRKLPWIIGAAVLIGAIILVIVLVSLDGSGPLCVTAKDVATKCDSSSNYLTLSDDEKTIDFTYRPGREGSDAVYECLLEETNAPSSVDSRLGETRALDGMQHAEWDGWEMYWNYHPDSGAPITLSEK